MSVFIQVIMLVGERKDVMIGAKLHKPATDLPEVGQSHIRVQNLCDPLARSKPTYCTWVIYSSYIQWRHFKFCLALSAENSLRASSASHIRYKVICCFTAAMNVSVSAFQSSNVWKKFLFCYAAYITIESVVISQRSLHGWYWLNWLIATDYILFQSGAIQICLLLLLLLIFFRVAKTARNYWAVRSLPQVPLGELILLPHTL